MTQGCVLIACALMPEAAALIEALGLEPGPKFGSIRIFGQHSSTPLAVTGIGAQASATAVGILRAQRSEDARPSVLNVGVAGHSHWQRGTAWLAHQVLGEPGRTAPLYPGFSRRPQLPTDKLTTRSRVERDFQDAGGYDMEGYGCLSAALCFASSEQCALLKVVSDGPMEHQNAAPFRLDARAARTLITDAMPAILRQIQILDELSQRLTQRCQPPQHLQELLATGHFSQAQRHRLKSLLVHWEARFPDLTPDLKLFDTSAQAGLDALHAKLNAYEPLRDLPIRRDT